MRHLGRHLAERGEPPRPRRFGLQTLEPPDVLKDEDVAARLSVAEDDFGNRQMNRNGRPVRQPKRALAFERKDVATPALEESEQPLARDQRQMLAVGGAGQLAPAAIDERRIEIAIE